MFFTSWRDDKDQVASLPKNYQGYEGLTYPTTISTLQGKIEVHSRQEHHELIQKLLNQKSND